MSRKPYQGKSVDDRLYELVDTLIDKSQYMLLDNPDNTNGLKQILGSLEIAVRTLKTWENLGSSTNAENSAEQLLEQKLGKNV
jgi:hypothetical protein